MMEAIMGWLGSAFSSALTDGHGNVSKGVSGALKLAMMGGMGRVRAPTAHSNVQAQAFHYQSNANPITALKTGFDYMKNDIDPSKGFNDVKNLF